MAEVHHFAFGWINPVFAYLLSFLGTLLGLVLAARAREASGGARFRWLTLAGFALGVPGIWLMHFMAMIGFEVPSAPLRYNVPITAASLALALLVVSVGLYLVGFGRISIGKIVLGGLFAGIGIVIVLYTGLAAIRLSGHFTYDPVRVGIAAGIAVLVMTFTLRTAMVAEVGRRTFLSAGVIAAALSVMHYVAMSSIQVHLTQTGEMVNGVSSFVLLAPISILACVAISSLAYATIGFTVRQENAREERVFERNEARMANGALPRHASLLLARASSVRSNASSRFGAGGVGGGAGGGFEAGTTDGPFEGAARSDVQSRRRPARSPEPAAASESATGAPSMGEPAMGESVMGESVMGESVMGESVLGEPVSAGLGR